MTIAERQAAITEVQSRAVHPAFQQRCLTLIEALPEGEVPGESRALLTDRVLLAQGAPQRFGSQVEGDCSRGFKLKPLEESDHVDERRAALGMGSVASCMEWLTTFHCTNQTRP